MTRQLRDPQPRQRIVVAARKLVAEEGVHSATMRAIALEAGVSTGAVTHYFDDKADVMTAVIHYNNELVVRRMTARVRGKSGLKALEAAMEGLLPLDEEMMTGWTVLIAFWGHAPAQRFVQTENATLGYRGLRAYVTALLREAAAAGEVAADLDVEHQADRILALVGGIGLMVGGFAEMQEPMRKRARRMLEEIFDDLRPAG